MTFPSCPNKVLSLHEPHVVAIAKGKRAKPNEYGCKVSISTNRNGYVVGHQEYAENIADTKSLYPALDHWEEAFGKPSDELGADRGYHTPTPSEKTAKIKRVAIPRKGSVPHPDKKKPNFRRLQRQQVAIEPVIGHLKSDHRMDCSRYKGFDGDRINVGWAVIAWNTKKWVRRAQGNGEESQGHGRKGHVAVGNRGPSGGSLRKRWGPAMPAGASGVHGLFFSIAYLYIFVP